MSDKIYIQHNGDFYEYTDDSFSEIPDVDKLGYSQYLITDKRDFEIGAKVYFENEGWMEVVETTEGERHCYKMCALTLKCDNTTMLCGSGRVRSDNKTVYLKKLNITKKTGTINNDKFYVLNTRTNTTTRTHDFESSALDEAARLAQKQPGDIFRVLKVIGECKGSVNVEWSVK